MLLALSERFPDLTLHKTVRSVHHAFGEITLPIEWLCSGKNLAECENGNKEQANNDETCEETSVRFFRTPV